MRILKANLCYTFSPYDGWTRKIVSLKNYVMSENFFIFGAFRYNIQLNNKIIIY